VLPSRPPPAPSLSPRPDILHSRLRDREVSNDVPEETGDREFLSAVLATLTTGVIVTDERFTVRWFNLSAAEVFPEATAGRGLYELLAPFAHEQKIDRLLLRRERVVFRFSEERPPVEWLRARRRMPDGGHLILAWPARLTDEAVERRVDFTMAAFHELRTPLTALVGFAELLQLETDGLSSTQLEAVEMIDRTSRRLFRLGGDILDLARNSFGELRLNLEPVDFGRLVQAAIDVRLSDATGICPQVEVSLEPGLPAIEADPGRLGQVIGNLLDNACIHNPEGTTVRISLTEAGGGLRLVIEDDGDGLDFAPPEKAFNTFFRPDSSVAEEPSGSGVGLPLAKRLVDLHRGRLTLDSSPGRGTRATVWLPLERDGSLPLAEAGPGG